MRPEYKVGDDVYIGRNILYDAKVYTIYDIDDVSDIYTIIEKGSIWNYDEGHFELSDGEIVSMSKFKYEDLMTVETGLDFLIDRFSFLMNRHVMKTTKGYWEWKPVKDDIIDRITKKIYDNR